MNSSVCSDAMYMGTSYGMMADQNYIQPLMSTTNAHFLTQRMKIGCANMLRPSTTKGANAPTGGFFGSSMKLKGEIAKQSKFGHEDQLFPGELSMIDRFGGIQGDEQFLDEQSFNQELLLMKLDVSGSPPVRRKDANLVN